MKTTVGAGDALDARVLIALADGQGLHEALTVGVEAAGHWLAEPQLARTSRGGAGG